MNLPGRLRTTTLGDLLGSLYRDRATGVLELVEWSGATAGRCHRVHLSRGLVGGVDTVLRVDRLGEILERAGFVESGVARLLTRRLAELPHKRTGEILIDARLATPTVVTAALRHQLRSKLDALFQLPDARIKFHVARPMQDPRQAVPLSPREFLHGRLRKRDVACAPGGGRGGSSPWHPRGHRASGSSASMRRQVPTRSRALEVLGLGPSADQDAVRRAFRRLAAEVHPDRHPTASAGEVAGLMKRFAQLSAAYHELVA
jgi:hypothetical protein